MWATIVLLVPVECLVISWDVLIIMDGLYENTHFDDVKWNYYLSLGFAIALPFVDLFSTFIAALLCKRGTEIQKDPIQCLIPCKNTTLTFCIHCVGIAIIVLAAQLIVYHSYYILLAFIASPIHACSILLYAAGFFCLVVFITFFIKAFSHPKRGCLVFIMIVLIIMIVIVLVLFIFVFIQIIILVGEHRNSGGILSFVGSLGPPVLLSAIGYFGKEAIKLLNVNSKKEDSKTRTASKSEHEMANFEIRHQEMRYENSETVLRARQTIIVTHSP